jgi:hypothetical protein
MEKTNPYPRCVYASPLGLCPGSSPLHPKEHYLPAGLGNFKDDVLLRYFICYECQERFSKFEAVFLQNSSEAFFRRFIGISGRRSHKQKNIFVDPTLGLPPLTVKALHPTLGYELLWEATPKGELFQLNQLVFRKEDGLLEHVPLRAGLLARDLARFGEDWRSWQLLTCISGSTDEAELDAVLGEALVAMKDAPNEVGIGSEIEGEMRAQITLPYIQAICKIAFHFVLAHFHFTGFEPEFDALKQYIYTGVGPQRALITQEPLLPQLLPENARLRMWSHILTAEFNESTFSARVQFFAGPQLKPFTWRVDLGASPSRVLSEQAQGFHFYYFDKPDASGYVGAIARLRIGPKMPSQAGQ